jgi:hypothetical protein
MADTEPNWIFDCPCCGSQADLEHDEMLQYIECSNSLCMLRMTDWGGFGTEWLVKAWNKRVTK